MSHQTADARCARARYSICRQADPVSDTYLWEVFESSKAYNLSVAVNDSYRQVGCLNEFQNIWVGIDTTVDIILANLDQVDDIIQIVRIGSTQNDALKVKLHILLQLLVHHLLSLYHRVASVISLCLFHSFTKSAFL